jgi:hypothetical protein
MADRGRYLFAVARGLGGADLEAASGLRGAPLEVVDHHGLQAVVCDVDLAEFGEDALPQRLEDLAWLEEVARAHNDVVWQVADRATVAPMRLVTICADDDSVRRRVEDNETGLRRALDGVEGRREWSVKAYAVREEEPTAEAAPAPSGAGAGAAYLQRKKQQATRRQQASDRSVTVAETVYDALAGRAVASRRLPPQDPRLTGRREPMILNSAFLVESDEGDAFVEEVSRLQDAHPGATIEAQGPWPPYSFAVLE